jgi:hypothetical protein
MLKTEVYILTAHALLPNLARHVGLRDGVPAQVIVTRLQDNFSFFQKSNVQRGRGVKLII